MTLDSDSDFSFLEAKGSHPVNAPDATRCAPKSMECEAMCRALESALQVSYHWSIATDAITWSANAETVLGCGLDQVATGRRFANLLDSNNFTSRYDTVMYCKEHDNGEGVGFEIEYLLKPKGRQADAGVWIEDVGRWFANESGTPSDVYGVMRLSNERHRRDQEMSYLSSCDALTGMMNRNRMADALHDAITVSINDKTPCAFAILAVSNLDVMNEAYGFEVADEVIVQLGQRLRKVMRTGDAIARYSGSKFGIILNNCKADELQAALDRFMRAVRDSVIETRLGPVWALLSIGAVSLPALGDNVQTAIAHAEEALSEAFRLPGDNKVVYTSSDVRKTRRALNARCATEIVECLRNNLFKLAFQPICEASNGAVAMHEALLRMQDSTGALITAGHLVPIAEQLGLVRLIDRAVLQMALHTLESYPEAKLSVNISATTANDPRWNVQLLEMIAAVPDLASRLVLEVTETAALGDVHVLREFMAGIRATGCGIALDDFGAGYTSYRNIKELPLSHIKLDGMYCRGLAASDNNRMFVESLVKLAKAFDLKIIAEWVETADDAQILGDLGVHLLQGHYLGEPSVIAPWQAAETIDFDFATVAAPIVAREEEKASSAASQSDETSFRGFDVELEEPLEDTPHDDVPNDVANSDVLGKAETEAPEPQAITGIDAPQEAPQPESDDFDWGDPDEGISKLRSALAELNAAFGSASNDHQQTKSDARLAS